jgi:hypothetical protein
MYRDDDAARTDRANALITEIAELERTKVAQAQADQRLEAARDELRGLQAATTVAVPPVPERIPSFATHFLVFSATAGAGFLLYALLLRP